MKHQLSIVANNRSAVLERILRVVRHRGFELTAMSMPQVSGSQIQLALSVCGEYPITQLNKQLDKLIDVTDVTVQKAHQDALNAGRAAV
ncbi:acetolactate synthase 2 small subunit [Kistimonas asteriae]|uniref:acetolactate synthase 2 small subunit n=1 Tax=Kistimonas asteriae TaxID=517724 RepID=UPI001BAACFA7|nr:acetolactate synthase 2 small subunit [Kistimonas asteriae]